MDDFDLSELNNSQKSQSGLVKDKGKSSSERIVLTSRDYKVLRYVLEMKFASTDRLFDRYFKTTSLGIEATSPEFMRRRLLALEQEGLITRFKGHLQRGFYYLATNKTRKVLMDHNPSGFFPKPKTEIAFNTFRHDLMLQDCMKEFEETLKIRSWISENSLRSILMRDFQITPRFCPDGMYELPTGELIAFELEIAVKDRSRYREKPSKLARYIDQFRDDPRMFQRVHFRCTSKQVYRLIDRDACLWPNLFKIELVDQSP